MHAVVAATASVAAALALASNSASAQDFPASASFAQLAGDSGCLLQAGLSTFDEADDVCARTRALHEAAALEVSPDQRHLYVVSGGTPLEGSNAVTAFVRDQATGALSFASCVSQTGGDGRVGTDGFCTDGDALEGASDLAVTRDGRFVYVTASRSNGVTWFERDAETGALTPRGCLTVFPRGDRCGAAAQLVGASGVDLSADGAHVYVTAALDGAVTVFDRDEDTGALAEVMCVSDTGSDGHCLDATGLAGASSVTVAGDGADVYVTAEAAGAVTSYRRDASSGGLEPGECLLDQAPAEGSCRDARALAGASDAVLTPDGGQLLVASEADSALAVFVRDAATGHLEPDQCFAAPDEIEQEPEDGFDEDDAETSDAAGCERAAAVDAATRVAVSADGRAVFVASPEDYLAAFQRDPASGRLQQFGCAEEELIYDACSRARNLDDARGLAVSGDGRSLYIATDQGVSVFAASTAIVTRVATVRRGAIRARLACPVARARRCAGRLSIAGARGARPQRFKLGTGRHARVTISLSPRLRRAIRRQRRVHVTLVAHDSDRLTVATKRRIRLRP
jgi:6-phosphogluconolactonase (cycloisomerase 2 family)